MEATKLRSHKISYFHEHVIFKPIVLCIIVLIKEKQFLLHTLGVNVVKTPETNSSASYDEWLGSA